MPKRELGRNDSEHYSLEGFCENGYEPLVLLKVVATFLDQLSIIC